MLSKDSPRRLLHAFVSVLKKEDKRLKHASLILQFYSFGWAKLTSRLCILTKLYKKDNFSMDKAAAKLLKYIKILDQCI